MSESLSTSEIAVLVLVAQGHTDEQIASLRGVVRQTIKTQMCAVREKLGVRSRVSAVVVAHQKRLIDVNDITVVAR